MFRALSLLLLTAAAAGLLVAPAPGFTQHARRATTVRMAGWNDEYGGTAFRGNKRDNLPKAAMGSDFDKKMKEIDEKNNQALVTMSLVTVGGIGAFLIYFLALG